MVSVEQWAEIRRTGSAARVRPPTEGVTFNRRRSTGLDSAKDQEETLRIGRWVRRRELFNLDVRCASG